MILLHTNLTLSSKTTFSLQIHSRISIRFTGNLPIGNAQAILKIFGKAPLNNTSLITFRPSCTALVRYDPTHIENYYSQLHKPKNTSTQYSKDARQTAVQEFCKVDDNRKKLMQINNDAIFIKEKISTKEIISEDKLKSILFNFKKAYETGSFTKESQESCLRLIRNYFKLNPPSLEITHIFLDIWKNHNFREVISINIQKNKENILAVEEKKASKKVKDKKSYEEKKQEAEDKVIKIISIMKELFITYKNDPEKFLYSEEVNKWYKHIETRSKIIPLNDDELLIYTRFKALKEKYGLLEKDLLKFKKDKLKSFKENNNLPNHLKEKETINKCFSLEDYKLEIQDLNDCMELLKDPNLSITDLKLLSIISSATVMDDEGTFKLSQEAYKSFSVNKEILGFKYSDNKPDFNQIISKIRNKEFFVAQDIPPKPDSIVPVAHLSHKTIIIYDDNLGKNVSVRIGLFTSSKSETTFRIDDYQVTNIELDKQNKAQMFRILSSPIIVEETLIPDIEMTCYLYGKNSKGEDIIQILGEEFEKRKELLSENSYQFTFTADAAFVQKLSLIFFEKAIQKLEEEACKLQDELDNLRSKDEYEYEKKIEMLAKLKLKEREEKELQRYLSLLPEELKKLEQSLRAIEEKLEIDKENKQNKDNKQYAENLMIKNKEEKEKQGILAPKTFKQKKEEYLEQKKQQMNENHDEKDI